MRCWSLAMTLLFLVGGCSLLFSGSEDAATDDAATEDAATEDADGIGVECQTRWAPWAKRMALDIDNTFDGSESLENFPLLVMIQAAMLGPLDLHTLGSDLRFSSALGEELSYEIDVWDDASTTFVWVKIPRIPANEMTRIWMYGGNGDVTNAQDAGAVWSNGYSGVWHFSSPASFPDVSGTLEPGVPKNASIQATQESDAIGGAVFVGSANTSTNYIEVPMAPHTPNAVTLEARVFSREQVNGEHGAIEIASSVGLLTRDTSTKPNFTVIDEDENPSINLSTGTSLPSGAWHYIAGTYDQQEQTGHLYLNGESVASQPGSERSIAEPGVSPLILAKGLQGTIDEARISSVARSAGWISAQHRAMKDMLINARSITTCPE